MNVLILFLASFLMKLGFWFVVARTWQRRGRADRPRPLPVVDAALERIARPKDPFLLGLARRITQFLRALLRARAFELLVLVLLSVVTKRGSAWLRRVR